MATRQFMRFPTKDLESLVSYISVGDTSSYIDMYI
jgi:hypothetical protein